MKRLLIPLLAIALFLPGMKVFADTANSGTQKAETAMFAAGCFWKTQYVFGKVPGVISTRVGYSGGTAANPSYEQVCSDRTGHAETVQVKFDPAKVTYHKLLEVFFSNHDPTTVNRQGPDNGTQYRSVIFYSTASQQKEALAYKDELNRSHKFDKPVVTEIVPAGPFYAAEEYHQNYYVKHGAVCF